MADPGLPFLDEVPDGFVYAPDFLMQSDEEELLAHIEPMEFSQVRMHGVVARRRVRQFGWHYSFDSYRLTEGSPIPSFLLPLQLKAAVLAGVTPAELSEALIAEYQPGATIGWHRDAPVFGVIVGVSLRSACRFKLRRGPGERPRSIELLPRSAYVLDGEARRHWQHSIPATKDLRYSVTFRTLLTRRPEPEGRPKE